MPHSESAGKSSSHFYYRHRWPVRILHWINALSVTILLMSGLQIFNAHPMLYWGKSSYTGAPPILAMSAKKAEDGDMSGMTEIFGHSFDTTGVLGASKAQNGEMVQRGFPSWATIPGPQWLSMARQWHLFFTWVFVTNGVAYALYAIFSGHLAADLAPTRTDWRSIGQSIKDHLRFRHPAGEAAKHYNILQKLTYLIVIFGLLPLIALMGWAMSPWLDTVIPGWVDVVGGRQSARTLHFVAAWLLVAFALVHVFEVIVSGLWNNLRSMITGRYRVPPEVQHEAKT